MEQLETMPTAYHRERWAIFVRDPSVQVAAKPHHGRAVGAVVCVAPNAVTAREALRLLELEEPQLEYSFVVISIASFDAAKRALLKREYESIQSLAMRCASGDIRIDGDAPETIVRLHNLVTDRVRAIWDEGSLRDLPSSVSESRLTWDFAQDLRIQLRHCLATMETVQSLANSAEVARDHVAHESLDLDDFYERISRDAPFRQLTDSLSCAASDLYTSLTRLTARLRSVGLPASFKPSDVPAPICPCEGPIEGFDDLRDDLQRSLRELSWHTDTLPRVPTSTSQSASVDAQPVSDSSIDDVRFEEPNILVIGTSRIRCQLATRRLTLLRALLESGCCVPLEEFAKGGRYCLWPTHSYPRDDSPTSSRRRASLQNAASSLIGHVNKALANLSLPRSMRIHVASGTLLLTIK